MMGLRPNGLGEGSAAVGCVQLLLWPPQGPARALSRGAAWASCVGVWVCLWARGAKRWRWLGVRIILSSNHHFFDRIIIIIAGVEACVCDSVADDDDSDWTTPNTHKKIKIDQPAQ